MPETIDPLDVPERVPTYQIVRELETHSEPGHEHSLTLVKLSKTIISRLITGKYVESDYILIGVSKLDKEDKDGTFHYEETTITPSDEEGTVYEGYVYKGPRALTVAETMWILGEI